MDQFLDQETDANRQFLDPEVDKIISFWTKIFWIKKLTLWNSFWVQKLTYNISFWSQELI